ncbi:Serine/threonine exchanger SteT [Halomonadaceae bacterium LMG 33818]|uniref:APC family permease n=1 Tax=Cernens ardua TaxID=3402176 RepID=UPI003EDBCE3A
MDTPHSVGLRKRIGLWRAVALNMVQMCGVGPFITIPAMVAMFHGPQAVMGWVAGALLALCDGLVWAELGAAMPGSGGTYIYLREAFRDRTGNWMPFLFVWTAILFVPLIMSTGVVGFVQYLSFFIPDLSLVVQVILGLVLILLSWLFLWHRVETISRWVVGLWGVMIIALLMVILASFSRFNLHHVIDYPAGAFALNHSSFWFAFAGGLTIGVYDYLGYNTTAYMGAEVENPGRIIPLSITLSIIGIMIVYLLMQVGMLGVIPWQQMIEPGTLANQALASAVLMATWGKWAAYIGTALILLIAFTSFTVGMLSGSRIPYEAARDGVFFKRFATLHKTRAFPVYGVIVMVVMTMMGFVLGELTNLSALIQLLTTVMIIVQSLGQIAAFIVLRRRRPEMDRPYRMWLYPLPLIIALAGWVGIYLMSDSAAPGLHPIELSLAWVAMGSIIFLMWARWHHLWPFAIEEKSE